MVSFFGEGALGQGVLYESMNMAALWNLPVVFVCENNLYSEYTHFDETTAGSITNRAAAFGIPAEEVDGQNLRAVRGSAKVAVERARAGDGPTFLVCGTYRWYGHYVGDIDRAYYRSPDEEKRWRETADPIEMLATWLCSEKHADIAALEAIREAVAREIEAGVQFGLDSPYPDHRRLTLMSMREAEAVGAQTPLREITFAEAVNEAISEEMERDATVFVIGEDVAEAGTPFKVLSGLVERFGVDRVMDSPISEAGITGVGVGAAMSGLRPIVDIMFGDFLGLTMDQLANQAAKTHYMSGGDWKVPMVLRTTLGASRRSAAQHSQSLHAWVSHVPGLKVALPATPFDAKGLLKAAIQDDNPVVFFEDKLNWRDVGHVPVDEYVIRLGEADVKREGSDVTVVATSSMVLVAREAAAALDREGMSVEVVDPRTTVPLDLETLVRSADKTGRVLVVDEGYAQYGVASHIAAVITEEAFYSLDAPVRRIAARDVPIPFSPVLEDQTVPTVDSVVDAVMGIIRGEEF